VAAHTAHRNTSTRFRPNRIFIKDGAAFPLLQQ
jgi:hypothetical protein